MAAPLPRAYLVFAVVALALFMSSLDSTVVAVGLPTMLRELHTNLSWLGWTLTAYQLTQTIIMPIAGKLSDEWGRKRLFLGAVGLFTISSIAAGLSPNVYFLIAFRVLQAVGGGIFLPSATGIVSDAFGDRRSTAIGLFTSIFPLGGVLGPNIGGLIIDNFTWRWVFYVNVPIGIVLIVVGLFILPKGRSISRKQPVDVVGGALFAAALISILYAMTDWANHPADVENPFVWLFVVVGLVLLTVFVWHESRTPSPMIELSLLKRRPFFAANLYNLLYGATVFGFSSFIPYYATVAYGMSAGEDGAIMTPRSLTMVVMSTLSSFFLIRFGYRRPMVGGLLLIALSLFLLSRGFHDIEVAGFVIPNMVLLALLMMLGGVGMGIGGPASSNAALDLLPEKVAAVAGLRGMFRSTGGVLGTAAIPLVLSRIPNQGTGLQDIYFAFAIILLAATPVVFLIPDGARKRYLQPQEEMQSPNHVTAD